MILVVLTIGAAVTIIESLELKTFFNALLSVFKPRQTLSRLGRMSKSDLLAILILRIIQKSPSLSNVYSFLHLHYLVILHIT